MARRRAIAVRDRPFRVRVESPEDLETVSAMLQDAIVPVAETAWRPREGRFAMMAQRFRWEDGAARPWRRVHCAFLVERVRAARASGLDPADRGRMLELLSIGHGDGRLELAFAGGATLRLSIGALSCSADDIGEPWPVPARPEHPETESADAAT